MLGRGGKWQYEVGEEAPAAVASSASAGLLAASASSVRVKTRARHCVAGFGSTMDLAGLAISF